ncbi:uncharacterized protein (DUF305 family) [Actinocorallia herbida]|uniref:Uncharacterized protein (DUF305 family) n=1 Tax=Actinocorallia herbida TaxID=58109 RepID=A0A3N1CWN7_9ACTN|nr:DUF305 domain-containing protein [Actinocorallia herbida]ROO85674.1 uncharacterized protein (DUF305 family) [Actinocorallia herbida]
MGVPKRGAGALAVAGLTAALLTGCGGGEDPVPGPTATMLAPGRPGEPNATVTAGPTADPAPAEADVTFMRMMIVHHGQAIEMSELAPGRAADPRVKSLASRISAAQTGEITLMRDWLRRHKKLPATDHDHHAMPGMITPGELAALKAARATEFDRRYLTLMIKHHEGALTMADTVLAGGTDTVALQLAKDVNTTQQAEINRMRALL